MKQDDAKAEILREFRALPKAAQQSGADRLAFAIKMKDKYTFKCSGDPYQTIAAWLIRESPEVKW